MLGLLLKSDVYKPKSRNSQYYKCVEAHPSNWKVWEKRYQPKYGYYAPI